MTPAPDVSARAERHRPKVLVAADFDDRALARLEGFADVTYAPFRRMKRMLSGPSLVEALAGFDVFVTEIDLVDAASLAALPDLRVVASCRGDAVNVDLDACTAFGIPVLNAPGRNADAVADLAIAFVLMLARKLPQAERFLHAPGIVPGDLGTMGKAFATLQGRELWEKTVGLVGLGAVGRKVAARLAGFGARVVAFDPFVDVEGGALADVEMLDLDTLLAESDFVSLHAAVNLETMGMIGANAFEAMKPDAYLINTARAALVDEEAMIDALRAGRIAGAALDTFAIEPPGSDHPLMALDNVVSTPHVGGNTADVPAHQGEIVVADLERLLDGEPPRHARNPDVLADFAWAGQRREPAPEELERLKAGPAPAVSDLQKKPGPKPAAPAPQPDPAARPEGDAEPRAHMTRLVQAFLDDALADASLSAFAAGQEVTLHFVLEDLDLPFHLQLGAGDSFRAALGDPRDPADVQLRLRAAVLDGMFTGAENPMEAAMEGRLAFTGDAAKAMTLQHMQADLERLYQGARARVGAPVGLTEASAVSAPPAAVTRATASPPDPDDPRHAIVQTVRELYDAGLVTATGGNVSTRSAEDDAVLWITPSRLFKGDLAPEVMVRIDLDGRSLDPGSRSPSSEWDLHCAIYRRKPEARAVIHAHAPKATILANAGLPFLPISTEAAFFGELPRVPFVMPGTPELARTTAEAMGDGWAALLVNHGLIVAGRSLRSAADMAEIIERTAEVLLGCHAVGRPPPVLPDDVVAVLRKMGDLVA
jgi:autoinducer 2 (AI-2) kinase